jgi:septum formation protein
MNFLLLHFPKKLFLASKSPRRAELLTKVGLTFEVFTSGVDEKLLTTLEPKELVIKSSLLKANAVSKKIEDGIVISADTVVYFDNEILGKPKDKTDAERMLNLLSGKEHKVFTGFTIMDTYTMFKKTDIAETVVKFKPLLDYEIKEYIATNNPLDKAGAYGIQDGICAFFIEGIKGCYYNVMGFPLNKFYVSATEFIKQYEKK